MKLDHKDRNNITLQSHVEVFADKMKEIAEVGGKPIPFFLIFVGGPEELHVVTNVSGPQIPSALKKIAKVAAGKVKGNSGLRKEEKPS